MDKVFKELIGHSVEMYVDNMVVKSVTHPRIELSIQGIKGGRYEAEPQKVRVWGRRRKILRLHVDKQGD